MRRVEAINPEARNSYIHHSVTTACQKYFYGVPSAAPTPTIVYCTVLAPVCGISSVDMYMYNCVLVIFIKVGLRALQPHGSPHPGRGRGLGGRMRVIVRPAFCERLDDCALNVPPATIGPLLWERVPPTKVLDGDAMPAMRP